MKAHRIHHIVLLILLLGFFSCSRDLVEQDIQDRPLECLPEGVPTTLVIHFDCMEASEVDVTTKSEASPVDETSIHDLYVMIFNNGDTSLGSARKIYGRFFSYDHLKGSLAALDADDNECWYVSNKTLDNSVSATAGAVKVSTITCTDAKLVVIANVTTSIINLDGIDPLDRLKSVVQYNELKNIEVRLEQHVVNRKDLFLMTAEKNVNTTEMTWGTLATGYDPAYRLTLTPIDAKVKFRVKVDPTNISAVTPVYWQVCNTPDRCFMYTDTVNPGRNTPGDISYFESQQYYFEGKEEVAGETWYTFCFYMLENNQNPNGNATSYFQRELQEKIDNGESGYKGPTGPESESFSDHFVTNGDWRYAPTFGTYVRFDLVLTLTTAGIDDIGEDDPDITIGHALTSDAIFTVHLGEFVNSDTTGAPLNNYVTKRGHSYTYNITVHNTKSIYTEVRDDDEVQAGQEGFLLLTDTEIINADCHYEYHQVEFKYRPDMKQEKFSWYVKTPFGEGGPVINYNLSTGEYSYDATGLDYLWVKFGINKKVPSSYTEANPSSPYYPDAPAWLDRESGNYVCPYSTKRHKYPGDGHYDPSWKPGQKVAAGVPCSDPGRDVPDLMDVTQLIMYVFGETTKYTNHETSAFVADDDGVSTVPVIRVTAFIDEFYYETDPLNPSAGTDPELWRKFVNANPRELHILSDAKQSRDKKSDVILSSHSIIQQSIQTIYNIYSADLHSLWGTEHKDEMRHKTDGWPYWPYALDATGAGGRAGNFDENNMDSSTNDKENGRLNTAYIWDLYNSQNAGGSDKTDKTWSTYINYDVNNNTPELLETYHGMAWSCLTRNRDNNGDGVIDRNEMRWYLAASNQLAGMWIGNESLSINARLYQPAENQWRAHVISSSGRRVSWTEEGGGATAYSSEYQPGSKETWPTQVAASLGESVRCLRNIGTYDDGGVTRDITEAPYDVEPQSYFTLSEVYDPDHPGDKAYLHYVFHFDHLNPKSLRELSEGELPYHDQFNVNNCVYLKMETQSRKDEEDIKPVTLNVDTDGDGTDETYTVLDNHTYSVKFDKINPIVTKLGYNPFCPPGYRFPNHSEQLLMSLYLPNEEYHRRNSSGAGYGITVYSPSRTYYDRGLFGKKTTGFEYDYRGVSKVTTEEQKKVGWGWSNKLHCAQKTDNMTVSRCVRDVSMTGTIEGGILMNDELYPGDNVPLSFSFYSSGATFIAASLKLCYTDGSGVYHERDIPVQSHPTGLQFLADQTVNIPNLTAMGLSEDLLNANNGALRHKTKFKITLRNAYTSKTFEQPFTLGNPLEASLTLKGEVPAEVYPSDAKTVDIDFGTKANTCKLNTVSMKLAYKDKNGADREVSAATLGIPSYTSNTSLTYKHSNVSLSIPNLSTLNLPTDADFTRGANFVIELSDMGGSTFTKSVPVTLSNPLTVTNAFVLSDAAGNKIYPSDQNHVTVGVHSKASTINLSSVSMALCYGASTTIPITGIPSLVGSVDTYNLTNQAFSIPALASMTGLDETSLDTGEPATIRMTVTAGDYTKTFESSALTISHPIAATTYTIDSTDDKIYPGDSNTVTLNVAAMGNNPTNLTTVTVRLYDGDTPMGSYIVNASINAATYSSSGSVTIPTLASLGLDVSALDPGTPYTLRAIVSNADGLTRTIDKTLTLSNPIAGSFSVPAGYVYAADNNTLSFDVSSQAKTSTLSSVSFKLTYTGIDGNTHNVTSGFSLPGTSGKTYSGSKTVTFPVLTNTPETDAADTSLPVSLTATFTDSGGITKEIICNNVPIRSHINTPVLQIPEDYSGSSPSFVFPVKAKLGEAVGGYTVSAMKLQWKKNGESVWTTDTYDFDESSSAFQTVSDASTRASLSLSTGSYINYRAMSICSTDGTAAFSPVWSMWLARYNFVKTGRDKWSFPIQNLNIPGGDFIQASITETGGVDETNGNSVTKYELIGFGVGEDESVFYPEQKSSSPGNAIHVQRRETNKIQVYGWWKNKDGWRYKKFGNYSNPINVLFNSNGLYYQNNNLFDPTVVDGRDNNPSTDDDLTLNIYNLIHTTSMMVGSAQGIERPLATYHFVRVVRQYEIP